MGPVFQADAAGQTPRQKHRSGTSLPDKGSLPPGLGEGTVVAFPLRQSASPRGNWTKRSEDWKHAQAPATSERKVPYAWFSGSLRRRGKQEPAKKQSDQLVAQRNSFSAMNKT